MTPYLTLERLFARLRALGDAAGILGWDAQTLMPTGAAEGRAEQLATLRGLATSCSSPPPPPTSSPPPSRGRARPLAGREPARDAPRPRPCLGGAGRPRRGRVQGLVGGRDGVARGARRERLRAAAPHLAEVLRLAREVGRAKGEALGLAPYDALLDQYDPGLTRARIDPVFDALRAELPDLIGAARERQAAAGAAAARRRRLPGRGAARGGRER